jgi:hypothetical protein
VLAPSIVREAQPGLDTVFRHQTVVAVVAQAEMDGEMFQPDIVYEYTAHWLTVPVPRDRK